MRHPRDARRDSDTVGGALISGGKQNKTENKLNIDMNNEPMPFPFVSLWHGHTSIGHRTLPVVRTGAGRCTHRQLCTHRELSGHIPDPVRSSHGLTVLHAGCVTQRKLQRRGAAKEDNGTEHLQSTQTTVNQHNSQTTHQAPGTKSSPRVNLHNTHRHINPEHHQHNKPWPASHKPCRFIPRVLLDNATQFA